MKVVQLYIECFSCKKISSKVVRMNIKQKNKSAKARLGKFIVLLFNKTIAEQLQRYPFLIIQSFQIINMEMIDHQIQSYIDEEIEILNVLANQENTNIVKLYENFKIQNNNYIVMELADFDLDKLWLRFNKKIPENVVMKIILPQILQAYLTLHKNFILHRDIKIENILVVLNDTTQEYSLENITSKTFTFKLSDFGLAKRFEKYNFLAGTQTQLGSPMTMGFVSPEIQEEKTYGQQADMFSLGVILYQLLEGRFPFPFQEKADTMDKVKNGDFEFRTKITEKSQQLIRKMLKYDPQERLQWSQIYDEIQSHSDNKSRMVTRQDLQIKQNKTFYVQHQVQNTLPQTKKSIRIINQDIQQKKDKESQQLKEETMKNQEKQQYDEVIDYILDLKNRYIMVYDSCQSLENKFNQCKHDFLKLIRSLMQEARQITEQAIEKQQKTTFFSDTIELEQLIEQINGDQNEMREVMGDDNSINEFINSEEERQKISKLMDEHHFDLDDKTSMQSFQALKIIALLFKEDWKKKRMQITEYQQSQDNVAQNSDYPFYVYLCQLDAN